MEYKLYEVGGHVRDNLLGKESKDIDYSVVIEGQVGKTPIEVFDEFATQLTEEGYEIFLLTPDCFTIRAMFPKDHKHSGVADFVLARREKSYIEGTRQPLVELGDLRDDLERRDFTVNAIARDLNQDLIDPFNGVWDLKDMILRTPTDATLSFKDDPLRILRALRFCVTKGFTLSDKVKSAISEMDIHDMKVVSKERIKDEINKAFRFNTIKTLKYLDYFENVLFYPIKSYIFAQNILRIEVTNKK